MKRNNGFWINAGMWQERVLRLRRPGIHADETSFSEIKKASGYHHLVIDDLWNIVRTPTCLQPLLLVVNNRIEEKRPTCVTCDYTLKAIAGESPALASRLSSYPRFVMEGPEFPDRRIV